MVRGENRLLTLCCKNEYSELSIFIYQGEEIETALTLSPFSPSKTKIRRTAFMERLRSYAADQARNPTKLPSPLIQM
jgi:hypothetical protein